MKDEVFVVGDVHGEITLLKKLLEKWDREKQQLIFIGDLGGPRRKFESLFSAGEGACGKTRCDLSEGQS